MPAAAFAADPAPQAAVSAEHRLSADEIEKILEEAARKREGAGGQASPAADEPESTAIPIHGEMGFSIGTGGYRAAHGTAVVGLPGDGFAIISLGTRRLPNAPVFHPDW